jgi:hypothetical protein
VSQTNAIKAIAARKYGAAFAILEVLSGSCDLGFICHIQ